MTHRPPATGWAVFTLVSFLALGQAGLVGALAIWAAHLVGDLEHDALAMVGAGVLALAGLAWLVDGVPETADVYEVTFRGIPSLLAVVGVQVVVVAAWRGASRALPSPDLQTSAHRLRNWADGLVRRTTGGGSAALALIEATSVIVAVAASTLSVDGPRPSLVAVWVADVAWFAVPGLVFAAGARAAHAGVRAGAVQRCLERLLVPYLAISLVALGLRRWSPEFPPTDNPGRDLLLGAAFEPYHLVLTLTVLTVASPALLRLRGRTAVGALVAAIAAQTVTQAVVGVAFWRLRTPLLWVAFYLAGVLAWRHRDRLDRWSAAWPGLLLGWVLCIALALVVAPGTAARRLVVLLAAWLVLLALWQAGRGLRTLPRVAWSTARDAYLVYLLHVPFVLAVTGAGGVPAPSLLSAAGWAIGLIGAMSVIVIGRQDLGDRTARLLGG